MSLNAGELKIEAGRAALAHVGDGMRLGIGSGSTSEAFIGLLGGAVADGLSVVGVPTSARTAALCEELKIPLTTLEETPELDLTIDGADEVGPELALIKGGGGALLREKIVASASKNMIVVADAGKVVPILGRFPLPVEVNAFGLKATMRAIEARARALDLTVDLALRERGGAPFVTDGGHLIVDASFGRIPDPRALANALNAIAGVVENGLFIDLAKTALIAGTDGVRTIEAT